jgi:DNA-directed RNA polymerase subunit D
MAAERKAEKGVGEYKMDIRLLEKNSSKTKISFLLNKVSTSYVNTLRRIFVNRVPVLAIETVEFKKNNSVMYDEQVAHRLGLVPLVTDYKSYNLKSECKCGGKGCAQCELKLKLKAKGEKIVVASDIKSTDPKVKPAQDGIPIVKLLKGQELELLATAELSEGREHAKWAPGLVFYRYKPDIKISKKGESREECAKVCPVKVFDFNNKLKINQDNYLKCHLCGACEEASNGEVKVTHDKTSHVVFMESWGQLNCKDMAKIGVERFNKILDTFSNEVKKTLK